MFFAENIHFNIRKVCKKMAKKTGRWSSSSNIDYKFAFLVVGGGRTEALTAKGLDWQQC